MENLCFFNSVSLFMKMLAVILLLLLPNLTLSSPPEKFYVNCGSDSNITYGGRTFVGDMSSSGNSVSFTREGTEAINQSGSSSEIYRTVRIFKQTSSYKFQLDSAGLHFVRLHFSAASSRPDLLTARFTVSTTSSYLKNFSLQNINETPRVEEFLLMFNTTEFDIRFVPDPSSIAFVNAIEVFTARDDLTILSDSEKNLHTIYRLNVGDLKVTPENDTLGRTWSLDDDFLYIKDSAIDNSSIQTPNYEQGSLSATDSTAPDFVYKTAKTMNRGLQNMLMNVSWSFKVKSNSTHFIRAHLSDIKSVIPSNPESDFYLYVNGKWRLDVQPSGYGRLATPFYIDVVNVSDVSGRLNVSIGNKERSIDAGFLNGLEIMELLEVSNSVSSNESRSVFRSRVYIIIGSVVAGLVVIVLVLVFLKRRRLKAKKKHNGEATVWSHLPYRGGGGSSHTTPFDPINNSPLRNLHLGLTIPFIQISIATNNFDEKWLIGRGGFGDVYKAILPNGSKAAIKRGKADAGQGILEFQTEIQILSQIRHKHLVSLTGYCEENSEMILVYEFMEKGTLREHLYGSNLPSLTWNQRLDICIGAAKGLDYLHSGAQGAIIHRDVKSTNILLDENNVAKVADFGLSKITIRNQDLADNNTMTCVKGTFGYLDPEYMRNHVLTEKSDVYAFGVVLLEILCARAVIDPRRREEEVNLAEWALFCKSKGVLDEILDPRLNGQIEPSAFRKFFEIAEKCLKEYGDERPSMRDVIWDLEYVVELQKMPIGREPHEDSDVTMGGGGGGGGSSLVIPRLMVSDSFSVNSAVQKSSYGGGTESSESRVFSQLKISEAR